MSQPNERHVLLPVICEHCQQKQMVQMRARSEFHAMYAQSIKCVKCENSFDVTRRAKTVRSTARLLQPSGPSNSFQ
jgi:hypothetical protein